MINQKNLKVNILFFFFIFFFKIWMPIGADEAEHLHFSYLLSLKQRPFIDFWEHHMPLIWYFLYPVNLVSDFLSKMTFARLIQSTTILISANLIALNFPIKNRNYIIFLFISLILIFNPWINYGDIRPEIILFICIPVIILILKNYKKINDNKFLILYFSLVLMTSIFFTPRAMPLVIASSIFSLFVFKRNDIFFYIIFNIILILFFFTKFYYKDIFFFVFEQSYSLTRDYYNLVEPKKFFIFIILLLVFCFVLFKKKKFFLHYLFIITFLFIFVEKKTNLESSTLASLIIAFIIFVNFFYYLICRYKLIIIMLTIFFIILGKFVYFSKSGNNSFFDELPKYTKLYLNCQNKFFQGNSFSENIRNSTIHPIFVEDLTYFGFYQGAIIDKNIRKILNHNKGKKIIYIKRHKKICFSDTKTLNKIKIILLQSNLL